MPTSVSSHAPAAARTACTSTSTVAQMSLYVGRHQIRVAGPAWRCRRAERTMRPPSRPSCRTSRCAGFHRRGRAALCGHSRGPEEPRCPHRRQRPLHCRARAQFGAETAPLEGSGISEAAQDRREPRKSSTPARPYVCCLMVFSRFTGPSNGPLFHRSVSADRSHTSTIRLLDTTGCVVMAMIGQVTRGVHAHRQTPFAVALHRVPGGFDLVLMDVQGSR